VANLATQVITLAGIVPTYSAASGGGDTFTPGDDVIVHVKNGGGSPVTVTVVTPNTAAGGLAISDDVVTVAAGSERVMGPFPKQNFSRSSDGLGDITYSGVTSVTVAVLDARRV
jgi:hypothetical protein